MQLSAKISHNSLNSAGVLIPIVLEYMTPSSVLDIGCKHGEWLSVFQRHGIADVQGLDRARWRAEVLIDPATFRVVDLSKPFSIDRRFDLSVCVEVAEHLPESAAEPLVRELTAAAPVVLFSAALPGQGGHGHVNEQPHAFWDSLFAGRDFVKMDCLRPRIWQDARVAWWYRQNIFLYASAEGLARWPALRDESQRARATDMKLVHADVLREQASVRRTLLHNLQRITPGIRRRPWYS
jgi:hypothetical protein